MFTVHYTVWLLSAGPNPRINWEGCVRKYIQQKTCAKSNMQMMDDLLLPKEEEEQEEQ